MTGTLTDAGPLIAIIDADDPDHSSCMSALDELSRPLVTTWPAFTEAMHILGRIGGLPAQQALWRMVKARLLELLDVSPEEADRAVALMGSYSDTPMDLADATLVSIAEARGRTEIFTLDSDFAVYRLYGRKRFAVFPAAG